MSYNLDNLRILWEFATDGLIFYNIKSASPSYSGDYAVTNIKNDIVEMIYKVFGSSLFIQIDAGEAPENGRTKAITIDTFALLNTNLTLNAQVSLYGYGDATSIAPTKETIISQGTLLFSKQKKELSNNDEYEKDLIWISQTEEIRKFRHWLLLIDDPRNLYPSLEIGRVLGGQASILSNDISNGSSSFLDAIDFEEVSYTDKLEMNGFITIANERALKKTLKLSFEKMNISSQNYKILKRYWRYCRDTKKALIIPTPKVPTAFHLFSKLKEMPSQSINYVEDDSIYVDFNLNYDEAK